jgi:hypothetical protein
MSMWGGNILPSDEFAPDAGRKSQRRPWRLLGSLTVVGALAAAGGLVWKSWPRVASAPAVAAPASSAPPATATPAAASPTITPAAAAPTTAPEEARKSSAPVSESATNSGVGAAPSKPARVVKSSHTTRSKAKLKSNKRRHQVASKHAKHAKTTRIIAADK